MNCVPSRMENMLPLPKAQTMTCLMKASLCSIVSVPFIFACSSAISAEEIPDGTRKYERVTFEQHLKPLLNEYCYQCHGQERQKGELNLQIYGTEVPIYEDRRVWEKVLYMIESKEMPPEGKPEPSFAQRKLMVTAVKNEFAKFDCTTLANPGRVTVRRLNRVEYNNTIRDLMGVDFKPAADFPNDEVGYGFDNIGDVLSLPPMLMEKYLDAAERITSEAIKTDWPPPVPVLRVEGEDFESRDPQESIRGEPGRGLGLYREGKAHASFELPRTGKYILRIRAFGDQAGPEPPKLEVGLNGEMLAVLGIKAVDTDPQIYKFDLDLKQGRHEVSVAYLNNYNVQDHPDPSMRGDRNLFVRHVEMEGPVDAPPPPLPETHTRIIPRQPDPGEELAVAAEMLQPFAFRAYRRPVQPAEVDRLVRLVDRVLQTGGSFEEGIQVAVQAVLCSPHFLFRWELDSDSSPAEVRELDDYEVASRLSYFLWSSMPDEELFKLAEQGRLTHPEVLAGQVERMIQDSKARALVENFAGQWLQFRNLSSVTPDPERFPEFDDSLRLAMQRETQLFFEAILRENRSVLEFLDTDFTFLNERLAEHYGIEGVKGSQFQRVSLKPDSARGGILTQASVLTLTSNPTRTSPVLRGKWILEQILGTPPPPPPPDVPELESDKETISQASLRQRLEQHRAKPECATCHNKMDPIGFAFENFDAIGRWRNRDGDFPIDPSGTLPTGETFKGPGELKRILKQRETFVRTVIEKMLTYALGRGLEYYDQCTVDDIYHQLVETDYQFMELVKGIVQSEPFLMKKPEGTKS